MAISWPTGARNVAFGLAPQMGVRSVPQVAVAELPGGKEVYRTSSGSWEARGDDAGQRVPFLGVAGRMGVVRAGGEHADAAFELLLWLTEPRLVQPGLSRQPVHDALPPLADRRAAGVG